MWVCVRVRDVTVAGGGGGGAGLQRGHPPAGHPGRTSSLSTISHFVFSNTNLKNYQSRESSSYWKSEQTEIFILT